MKERKADVSERKKLVVGFTVRDLEFGGTQGQSFKARNASGLVAVRRNPGPRSAFQGCGSVRARKAPGPPFDCRKVVLLKGKETATPKNN